MKVGNFGKIKRKYLRLAAVYRRFAERNPNYNFSIDALIECYNNETHGSPTTIPNNGYIIGKKWKDLTIQTWREDISAGYFCKAEYITPLSRWYAEPALSTVIPAILFSYENI